MIQFSVCQLKEALKQALLEVGANNPPLPAIVLQITILGTFKIKFYSLRLDCVQNIETHCV